MAGAAHADHTKLSLPVEGGIEAAYRAELAAAADPAQLRAQIEERLNTFRSPFRTAEAFLVEEIIDPRETRPLLCEFANLAAPLRQPGIVATSFRPLTPRKIQGPSIMPEQLPAAPGVEYEKYLKSGEIPPANLRRLRPPDLLPAHPLPALRLRGSRLARRVGRGTCIPRPFVRQKPERGGDYNISIIELAEGRAHAEPRRGDSRRRGEDRHGGVRSRHRRGERRAAGAVPPGGRH